MNSTTLRSDQATQLIRDALGPEWTNAKRAKVRGSVERAVSCPFHADAHPSLRIPEDRPVWFCFPCGRGGGAIELAKAKRGEARTRRRLSELLREGMTRNHRA